MSVTLNPNNSIVSRVAVNFNTKFNPPLFASRPDFHSQNVLIASTTEGVLKFLSKCNTYEKFANIAFSVVPGRLFEAIDSLPNKDELNQWLNQLELTI